MDELTAMDILTAEELGLGAKDWKRMYTILLAAIDRALDILSMDRENRTACYLLQKALEEAEEYYISAERGNREI